ncbi:MAG TPA: hypothetical protein PKX38_04295 [Alphaproteobacteria bacterium]|nr:hypothetical protein [Micavibrio sp.]MBK9561684.1 hypothetical protein [Micavibrio sp.]HQX27139.1 hypothetical protein [Alphaproteobacteria bacterium]
MSDLINIPLEQREIIAMGVAFFSILTTVTALFGYRLALKNWGINSQLNLSIAPTNRKFSESEIESDNHKKVGLSLSLYFKIENFSKTAIIIEKIYFPLNAHASIFLGKEFLGPGIQFNENGYNPSDNSEGVDVINPNETRVLRVYVAYDSKNFKPVKLLEKLNRMYVVARFSGDKINKKQKYRLTSKSELSLAEEKLLLEGGYYKLPLKIEIERKIRRHLTRKHYGTSVSIANVTAKNPLA